MLHGIETDKSLRKLLNNPKLKPYEDLLSDIIYPLQKEIMAHGYDINLPSIFIDKEENDIELYWKDEKYDFSMLINIDLLTKIILLSAEFEKLDHHLDVRVTKDSLIKIMGAWLKYIKKNR